MSMISGSGQMTTPLALLSGDCCHGRNCEKREAHNYKPVVPLAKLQLVSILPSHLWISYIWTQTKLVINDYNGDFIRTSATLLGIHTVSSKVYLQKHHKVC